jgi:hypothetical protein
LVSIVLLAGGSAYFQQTISGGRLDVGGVGPRG